MMAALALLRRFWWAPAIAGLFIVCAIQRATIARKTAALQHAEDVMQITIERIGKAQAIAHAKDLENARRIETAQTQASQEIESALIPKLEAARAAALDYARRLRLQAAQGGTRRTGQAGPASPPASPDGAGKVPLMDDSDLLICTENTVKAQGWLAWWKKINAIPR